jgi:hypothetical protein
MPATLLEGWFSGRFARPRASARPEIFFTAIAALTAAVNTLATGLD